MKLILSIISALIVTYSCSPINNQHGYILEDFVNSSDSISQFNVETTTENDILQTLGSPSIIINDVNNIWIYLVSIKKENIFDVSYRIRRYPAKKYIENLPKIPSSNSHTEKKKKCN